MAKEIDWETLQAEVDLLGKDYIVELTRQLLRLDKIASGRLIRSLDYRVIVVMDNLLLRILAEPYLKNVDEGRRPGAKPPPIAPILAWIKQKPVKGRDRRGRFIKDKSLAFVISRSIGIRGIPKTGVISIARKAVLDKRKELLGKAASKDVLASLNKILTKI